MATGTEHVTFVQCDNQSCRRRRYISNSGVAPGLYGTVTRVKGSGTEAFGERVDFYSCSQAPGHIGKAALGALEEPDNVRGISPEEFAVNDDTPHDQG